VNNEFYNKVAEETNKYAALSQREAGTVDNNWEDKCGRNLSLYWNSDLYEPC